MERTPEQIASCLNLDERAVLSYRPGTFLPRKLGRAWWNLHLDGLVDGHCSPPRAKLTPAGSSVRRVLLDLAVWDDEHGWGIQFVGRGEDCWWRPDAKGYTLDVSEAGLYSRDDALRIHGGERSNPAGEHGSGRDVAVPPARMRELVDAALAKAREGVPRLEQARDAVAGGAP